MSSGLINKHTPNDNPYNGHPRDATLERLHERGVDGYWTATHGTIDIVTDGEYRTDHDNAIERTAPADIAALKYYGRANDIDQEEFAEIETIMAEDLPEETPEWVSQAAIVTDQQAEEYNAKIDDLHELEVEQRQLTQKKDRFERTHAQRVETRDALADDVNHGLIGRLSATVSSLWGEPGTTETEAENEDHGQDTSAEPEDDGSATTSEQENHDVATESEQEEEMDLDATIAAYEQRNTTLREAVETLEQELTTLDADIETLEQKSADVLGRLTAAVIALGGDNQQTQQTVIRRARFSDTAASLAADGNGSEDTTATDTPAVENDTDNTTTTTWAQENDTEPTETTPDEDRADEDHINKNRTGDRGDFSF